MMCVGAVLRSRRPPWAIFALAKQHKLNWWKTFYMRIRWAPILP